MKRIIVPFVLISCAIALALFFKVRDDRAATEGPAGSSGIVEGTTVDVAARLAARLESVDVVEGQAVKRGDTIATLACDEPRAMLAAAQAKHDAAKRQADAAAAQATSALAAIDAASAQVGAAGAQKAAVEANQGTSERQVQRLSKLEGSGGATAMDLDRASAAATQLSEQVRALDAQLRAAKGQARAAKGQAEAARAQAEAAKVAILAAQADVARATSVVAECTLVAPMSGVVSIRAYEPGEVVLPGARVVTLVQLDQVEVTFYVPNRDLGAVEAGRSVSIVADAYPDEQFSGTIAHVAAEAEFTPRNVQTKEDRDRLVYAVRAKLENSDHRLRPGMPVEVRVGGGS
ncbi:MAG: efflux RND transporter periplasmic adaptor subunit [Deltaproteobacteria bacterium]|jgi:HlyD family secretion protein